MTATSRLPCPPGPAAPLVLAPTILRDRLELSLVYRTSCLPPDRAEDLLDGVLAKLVEWTAAHASPPSNCGPVPPNALDARSPAFKPSGAE